MLDVYVGGELAKRNIPLQNISEDGRSAYFGVNLSTDIFPGTPQMLCISTEANPVMENGKVFANASIVRSPLSSYRPPVYAMDKIPEKDRMNIAFRFRHYLAYEVLHVKNISDKEISFSLNGYDTNGSSWYKSKGAVSLTDGEFKVDSKATEEPIQKSEAVTIPPSGSDIIISGYIPNGLKMNQAKIVAEIDGTDVISSNTKSSDVTMQVGHAYHLYVTWDGNELKFSDVEDKVTTGQAKDIRRTYAVIPVSVQTEHQIVECGIVYSTSDPDPKVGSNGCTVVQSQYASGEFNTAITGLKASTGYYVRGYAKISRNGSSETLWGNVTRFTTSDKNGDNIVLERKYYVNSSANGSHANQSFSLVFDDEQSITIGYYNNTYDGKNGVYLYCNGKEWYLHPRIVGEWVQEKVIITPSGEITYYSNGELIGENVFENFDLSETEGFFVQMSPGGWYTGHEHFMDDFKLTTPLRTISDDFNNGSMDLSFWEKPKFANSVYVEDSVLKTFQRAQDNDNTIKSKHISLKNEKETAQVEDSRRIVLQRKYYVTSTANGSYANQSFSLNFDNGQGFSMGYINNTYDGRNGVYMFQGDQVCYIQPRISEKWTSETIIVTFSGKVKYYSDGKLITERVFTGLDLEDATSFIMNMSASGWYTGHHHYMDDLRIRTPYLSFKDNFDEGMDLSIWEKPPFADAAYADQGALKVFQNHTDTDQSIKSKAIPLTDGVLFPEPIDDREITVQRKYYVTSSANGSHANQSFSLNFDNEKAFSIGYINNTYDGRNGVYMFFGNQVCYIQPRMTEQWVNEKIVVTYTGKIKYYANGELVAERVFPEFDIEDATNFYLRMSPSGWYTGHQQYMDDLVVKTPYIEFGDNFDSGLDLTIWEKPPYADAAFVDEGALKVFQNRTDTDVSIRSKDIPVLDGFNFPDTGDDKRIIIQRKYYVTSSANGSHANQSFSLNFDNGKSVSFGYINNTYDGRNGVYVFSGDQVSYLQPRFTDEWVSETIIVSYTGIVKYYANGALVGEKVFPDLNLEDATDFYLNMAPSGWYTGHQQYMDDLRVRTPFLSFSDDFDDGLDLSIWEKPPFADAAFVDDGALKVYQNRSDTDQSISSKHIPLTEGVEFPVAVDQREIVLERKYFVTSTANGSYANQSFSLSFDNGKSVSVGYINNTYDGRNGVYVFSGNQVSYLQPRHTDEWVKEKIVVTYGGKVKYYANGELVGEKVFPDLNLMDATSFTINMAPSGWYTGHQQHMDDLKVTTPYLSFSDNFDNGMNLSIWERPPFADAAFVDQGVMKVFQNRSDTDQSITSKPIPLTSGSAFPVPVDERQIVMERKYFITSTANGSYANQSIGLVFDDGKGVSVGYINNTYDGRYGIYIFCGDQACYIGPRITDEWVSEKITVSYSGKVQCYTNGVLTGERVFPNFDITGKTSVHADMSPSGWYTGHQHFMDDFSLRTMSGGLVDSFDGSSLNTSKWEEPANPDGVFVEDGVVKTFQLRSDQDFHLRSVPVKL